MTKPSSQRLMHAVLLNDRCLLHSRCLLLGGEGAPADLLRCTWTPSSCSGIPIPWCVRGRSQVGLQRKMAMPMMKTISLSAGGSASKTRAQKACLQARPLVWNLHPSCASHLCHCGDAWLSGCASTCMPTKHSVQEHKRSSPPKRGPTTTCIQKNLNMQ